LAERENKGEVTLTSTVENLLSRFDLSPEKAARPSGQRAIYNPTGWAKTELVKAANII
jgi:hypothetical protein